MGYGLACKKPKPKPPNHSEGEETVGELADPRPAEVLDALERPLSFDGALPLDCGDDAAP